MPGLFTNNPIRPKLPTAADKQKNILSNLKLDITDCDVWKGDFSYLTRSQLNEVSLTILWSLNSVPLIPCPI